jgi:asparagine synthase (glutamine-hydrolysing)
MLDVVAALPEAYDEPFADSSAIPTYLVSRIARERVTVALSGDGGDELFFGYPRYWYHMNQGWALEAPAPVRKMAAAILSAVPRRRFRRAAQVLREASSDRYDRFVSWWSQDDVRRFMCRDAMTSPGYADVRRRARDLDPNAQPPLVDLLTYLPDDILAKVDRASMQVSLETRCPLLDHRVVEFALALPLDVKWRDGQTKWLLRRLLDRRVPKSLIDRPKMGFGVPLDAWMRGQLRDRIESLFASEVFASVGVDSVSARAEWRRFVEGRGDRPDQVWNLFTLAAWAERWRPDGHARTPTAHQ